MALAYAFIDEHGVKHGEPDGTERPMQLAYVAPTGPFAGQQLTMFAAPWDDQPSGTWIQATGRWGCFATIPVEEILDLH